MLLLMLTARRRIHLALAFTVDGRRCGGSRGGARVARRCAARLGFLTSAGQCRRAQQRSSKQETSPVRQGLTAAIDRHRIATPGCLPGGHDHPSGYGPNQHGSRDAGRSSTPAWSVVARTNQSQSKKRAISIRRTGLAYITNPRRPYRQAVRLHNFNRLVVGECSAGMVYRQRHRSPWRQNGGVGALPATAQPRPDPIVAYVTGGPMLP